MIVGQKNWSFYN